MGIELKPEHNVPPPKVKKKPKTFNNFVDKVLAVIDENDDKIEINTSITAQKHPLLAKYYKELNELLFKERTLGHRSHSIKMQIMNEMQEIRTKIANYKKNEGITREMEREWNNS